MTIEHLYRKTSLLSMQMSHQPFLVHWPCRTVGDHGQLSCTVKHLPPSIQGQFKDTHTHNTIRLEGAPVTHTDRHIHLDTLTSSVSDRGR